MNARHREKMSHPLLTKTVGLARYITDKSQQARRLVKQGYIYTLLKECMELWHNVADLLDGRDTANKAMRNLYRIQQDSLFIGFMERDVRKPVDDDGKTKKKHYGFDFHAVAYIDECCDNLLAEISAFGQHHKPHNKGYDERTVE